jgi:hypothetical protein
MDTFTYQPLPRKGDEKVIRLIQLLPGQFTEEIQCHVQHFVLAQTPPFIALSYCWGDPKTRRAVWCNGATLHILSNLYSALQHLRGKDEAEWLWADAICINQLDIQERNSQVLLMRDIYAHARQTTVWLGESCLDSDRALALIPRLAKGCFNQQANHEETHKMVLKVVKGRMPYSLPPRTDPGWRGFAMLIQRPWFYRIWVVQELAMSKLAVVQCGMSSVSWLDLVAAVHLFLALQLSIDGMFGQVNIIELARRSVVNGDEKPLLELLMSYQRFQASDLRDKAYAIYGLANKVDMHRLSLVPDYSLTTAEAYLQLTIAILRKTRSLDILSVSRGSVPTAISNLPSWVPDWTYSNNCHPLRSTACKRTDNFRATPPELDSEVVLVDGDAVLGLSGHLIDTIDQIGDVFESKLLFNTKKKVSLLAGRYYLFNNWENNSLARCRTAYITGGTRLDAYWQTIIAGDMEHGYAATKQGFTMWSKYNTHGIFRRLPFGNRKIFLTIIAFISLLLRAFQTVFFERHLSSRMNITSKFAEKVQVSIQRRIFRTKKGYIGLAPEFAQEGDRIGLFKGGAVPLVMRPDGGRWKLVGDSYVHGIMTGEAFKEGECKTMWIV